MRKAYLESLKPETTVVMLIPCKPDVKYFHDYIIGKAKEVRFIKGRLKFGDATGNETKINAPFPSMIVVFEGKHKQTKFTTFYQDDKAK